MNASSASFTELDVTNFAVSDLSAAVVTAALIVANNVTVVSALSVHTVSADSLWIGGSRQPEEAFCMVYAEASGTTTFSAAGAWQRALATTSAIPGLALNVTQTTAIGFMLTVNTNTSAVYRCDASVSMLAGGNSKVYQIGLAKNGVPIPQGRISRKVGTGSDVGAAGIMTSVVLTSGDTIEVVVRNQTDTTDFTVVDGTFNVTVI